MSWPLPQFLSYHSASVFTLILLWQDYNPTHNKWHMPPRFPITIVWNRHLLYFDSTREDQEFKAFAVLPSDLPFSYGSLTILCTSFRTWIGSYAMFVFDIPGLEFFAITRTDKFNSEWQNPEGTWFRQIIPTGCQLLNLFVEIIKEYIESNKDDPNYDYQDDSLDGRITWSPTGCPLCSVRWFRCSIWGWWVHHIPHFSAPVWYGIGPSECLCSCRGTFCNVNCVDRRVRLLPTQMESRQYSRQGCSTVSI